MNRSEAFAAQGVSKINRSQWHAVADDGVHVVSIWENNVSGDTAEAYVHKKHFSNFHEGMQVRAVIQRGTRDTDTGNMETENSEPDTSHWTILTKEIRSINEKRLNELHVVHVSK